MLIGLYNENVDSYKGLMMKDHRSRADSPYFLPVLIPETKWAMLSLGDFSQNTMRFCLFPPYISLSSHSYHSWLHLPGTGIKERDTKTLYFSFRLDQSFID